MAKGRERARPTSNWQFDHAVYGRGEKGDDDADEDQVEEEDEKKEARWMKQRSTKDPHARFSECGGGCGWETIRPNFSDSGFIFFIKAGRIANITSFRAVCTFI